MYLYYKNSKSKTQIPNSLHVTFRKTIPTKLNPLWLYWRFISWLKGDGFYEYQALLHEEIVCTAYVVPKNIKFPFIPNNGYHIGPCYTKPEYRGKGLYPLLLQHIMEENPDREYYMIIKDTNIPSIKGVQKVGFQKFAKGQKNLLQQWVIS